MVDQFEDEKHGVLTMTDELFVQLQLCDTAIDDLRCSAKLEKSTSRDFQSTVDEFFEQIRFRDRFITDLLDPY